MLIATNIIDWDFIIRNQTRPDEILKYCDSLVPEFLRNDRRWIWNQRYFFALQIRNFKTLPFKVIKGITTVLVTNIQITGDITAFYTLDDVLSECSMNVLKSEVEYYLERT